MDQFWKANNKQESWLHQHPRCRQMYISIFVLRFVLLKQQQNLNRFPPNTSSDICMWLQDLHFPELREGIYCDILGDNLQISWKLCCHMGKNGILPMQVVQTKALAGPCMHKPVLQLVTSQHYSDCFDLSSEQTPNILGRAGGEHLFPPLW